MLLFFRHHVMQCSTYTCTLHMHAALINLASVNGPVSYIHVATTLTRAAVNRVCVRAAGAAMHTSALHYLPLAI